jgi:Tol biopolymer transport system component
MMRSYQWTVMAVAAGIVALGGCSDDATTPQDDRTVPREERWGIYSLDLESEEVVLHYSSADRITGARLDAGGGILVFSQTFGGHGLEHEEICTIQVDGTGFQRLTENSVMDVYPCWSPDGAEIAFLSWRDDDMDIYVMDSDGTNVEKLYDSGTHDADIHWVGDRVVFTRDSQIWLMTDSGDSARQVTDPPNAGQWGNCNLPFGDYDPRISPDGNRIAFERLEDDASVHGNYNIFVINTDGTDETRLTDTGWSQGFATWSRDGSQLAYVVSAVGEEGRYDLYLMNADGTGGRNVTPDYFPADFLCYAAVFSNDNSALIFVGEWWEPSARAERPTSNIERRTPNAEHRTPNAQRQ